MSPYNQSLKTEWIRIRDSALIEEFCFSYSRVLHGNPAAQIKFNSAIDPKDQPQEDDCAISQVSLGASMRREK